jgi:phage terminase small subunit
MGSFAMTRKRKLTNKQRVFIDEYIKCLNGAEAARRAGYPAETARQVAYENLTKPDIQAEIEQRMKESAMSADEVLYRWTAQARGSMTPFLAINDEGFPALDFSTDEAKENLHLVKQIRTKRSRRTQGKGPDAEEWEDEFVHLELVDNQKALDALSKFHNLYAEKDDQGNPITDEQRIARVAEILDTLRARRAG